MVRTNHLAALVLAALLGAGAGVPRADPVPEGALPVDRDVFSRAMPGLNSALLSSFNYGLGLFRYERSAVVHPDGTFSGPGPLYNAASCDGCHVRDGRGRPPEDGGVAPAVSYVVQLGADGQPDPVYGAQLQDQAVEGVVPEGRIAVTYEPFDALLGDGTAVTLRRPKLALEDLAYGPLGEATGLGPRVAPQLVGLGYLAAVGDATLLALEDPEDADGDGISGVANRLLVDGKEAIGRFGWKAGMATLRAQVERAANIDMGLSVPSAPESFGECTPLQSACRAAARPGELEIIMWDVELIAFYVAHLGVPPRRNVDDPAVQRGEVVFAAVGCGGCHRPSLTTSAGAPTEFAAQVIAPYTDLLLHDMGPDLADDLTVGRAGPGEWRTPPLWGLGLVEAVSGHLYLLHDGRARGLLEAILWHGGEAQQARDAFAALLAADRDSLLQFLNSL